MAKSVTTIPATLSRFTAAPINSTKKRRVAAYARVSTDNEEQLRSITTPTTSKDGTIGSSPVSIPTRASPGRTPKSVRASKAW